MRTWLAQHGLAAKDALSRFWRQIVPSLFNVIVIGVALSLPLALYVAIKNLVLSGGASVRQDWCSQYGPNGCTATNITGGTVSMCP